jgi:protein TonB
MQLWIGLVLAVLVNFGLFTLMQQMTAEKHVDRTVTEEVQLLEFVRVKRETTSESKQRTLPEKPPTPKKPPPPPSTPQQQVSQPKAPTPKVSVPQIDIPLNIAGQPYLGDVAKAAPAPEAAPTPAAPEPVAVQGPVVDNEVIPIVRVPPRYPRKAARRNIEGVVTVTFIITKDGRVRDPKVVKATPEGVFENAALKAILKWKFKPKQVNGQAIERIATQEIEFKLK